MGKKKGFKEHFKNKGKSTSIILIFLGLIVLNIELFRKSDDWYYSLIFVALGAIVVPFLSWVQYKKDK